LLVLNSYFLQLRFACVPALHCHSCPLSIFACPVGVLVNFSALRILPFFAIGMLGIVGVVSGRLVCGWLCPFGLIQDVLHKIPVRKIRIPRKFAYTKYLVLIGLVFAVPFFFPNSRFTFCRVCPAATLEASIPWRIMGVSSGYGFSFFFRVAVLLGVLVLVVILNRGFCRLLCPLGAIFSLFNRFSLFRIRLTKKDCNDCGLCARVCPVGLNPAKEMYSPECIRCLKCTSTRHLKFGIK